MAKLKWQDAAIIIGMIGALLLVVLTIGGKTSRCHESAAWSADGQLCQEPKR
jgi:hypothetical protein